MKRYSKTEALSASLEYFDGDRLAADVFVEKYALRDRDDCLLELTPVDTHRRLARNFAAAERRYVNAIPEDEIFELLSSWDVVAQGSPMSGIGNPYQLQSLSNCFVIEGCQDSYGGIFRTDEEQAHIMKRRGGVGHDLSALRPYQSRVANAARTTDGVPSFMERFSRTTREVAQQGRRGALMITLSGRHPDIDRFVDAKTDLNRVTGANVSVRVGDDFMRAVRDDQRYEQMWPVVESYQDRSAAEPIITRQVPAREVWDKIVHAAWKCAEPGVLFWDRITDSVADCYADVGYRTVSTNPCGELPLSAYDSCRLLLVNLNNFVIDPYLPTARFDEKRFLDVAYVAQRLMDDLVDMEIDTINAIIAKVKTDKEPEEVRLRELELWRKVLTASSGGRRTGLGITALGDMLASLGVKYGTSAAVTLTDRVYRLLATASYASSVDMAFERGHFPVFAVEKERDHHFVKMVMDEVVSTFGEEYRERYERYGRRNIANLTTAPAGSMSTMTRTTSGCENTTFISYIRRRKVNPGEGVRVDYIDPSGDSWQEYEVFHPGVLRWARATGKRPEDWSESPYAGTTIKDVDFMMKIEMQAAAQRWVDHSISNTTNLPATATTEDVSRLYIRAWELGCKGVTVYRDGCRTGVLIEAPSPQLPAQSERAAMLIEHQAPRRPLSLPCDIHHGNADGKRYVVLIGLMDGRPYELFAGLAGAFEHLGRSITSGVLVKKEEKVRGVSRYDLHVTNGEDRVYEDVVELFSDPVHGSFTRLLSTALRHGTPVQFVVEQLKKDKHSPITSFSALVARVLSKHYIRDGVRPTSEKKCPSCSSTNLSYVQGCIACLDCGDSKCG